MRDLFQYAHVHKPKAAHRLVNPVTIYILWCFTPHSDDSWCDSSISVRIKQALFPSCELLFHPFKLLFRALELINRSLKIKHYIEQ